MTMVFRSNRIELGVGRVVEIRAIRGQAGKHRLVCVTCGESAIHRELFDVSEEFARQWIEKHETCGAKE